MSDVATVGPNYGDVLVEALTRYTGRDAFVLDDRRISYAETADTVSRIQQALSSLGIGPGRGVGILSPNAPEVFMVQAAAFLNGARYSGLHPLGSASDHQFLCDDAEIEVLIVHEKFEAVGHEIREKSASVKHLLTLNGSEPEFDLLKIIQSYDASRLRARAVSEEEPAWLQYTGGTTGVPKGVILSHRALVQEVQSLTWGWGLPERPIYLASSPITHAAVLPLLPTLARGGTVVLQQGFDPERWLDAIVRERINFTFVVPTMLYTLMDKLDVAKADTSSLETLVYGASPMSPQRIEEAQALFGPVLAQAYGQSECIGMTTSLRKDEHDPVKRPHLLTSCGRPIMGVHVELLDDEGNPVEDGQVGELSVRSRAVMNGYWKRDEETAQVLRDGWLRTSDMAVRDDEGFLHLVDRKKDMIVTGGFNVYPKEIEDVLTSDPGVSAAAVIGVPDPKWGELVSAYVVVRPGAQVDPLALAGKVREMKGAHQTPKDIRVVPALPTTPVGKIDKKALRAAHWSADGRQVN